MRDYIAVSACLVGANTKFNGKNNYNPKIKDLIKGKTVLLICPELFGGLETPRDVSEEKEDGRIYSINGEDVTDFFYNGAYKTLEFLKNHNCYDVVLKNGSPSCGEYTYDGIFAKRKIKRLGVTARLLKDKGFNLTYID